MIRIPRHASFLAVAILSGSLFGCTEGIEEAVLEADYFVLNQRAETACLSAQELFTHLNVQLQTSKIAGGAEAKIYHAWEGSGGHPFPSNFFSSFKATNCADSTDIFYEGVVNEDWQQLPNSKLLLTLSPPP